MERENVVVCASGIGGAEISGADVVREGAHIFVQVCCVCPLDLGTCLGVGKRVLLVMPDMKSQLVDDRPQCLAEERLGSAEV